MKRTMGLLLCMILTIFLVTACKNESNDVETLAQTGIVQSLEEKEYLLTRFYISYDEYRDIYVKYMKDGEEVDEQYLYMNAVRDDFEWIPMKDFIGKDIDETREYLLSTGYPLDSSDNFMQMMDEVMHEIEISDVYQDNYNEDWSYVFVREIFQSKTDKYYGVIKYHFELKDGEYKIIDKAQNYNLFFSNEELETLSQEEIDERIENQPFRYINDELVEYTKTIDLKKLISDIEEKTQE
ncbi:hypothetical protein [Vallitalea guaymasensis]|uniref:hypothetical protein n=1 Tax=Vallitalea guaymasensis TaxID=1185412 RepID=UPI00272C69D3|nr:hypothetical protein [Vallitalea guaymasensis]